MAITINQLEIENTKRVRAVSMMPKKEGLTVIGGKNNQGKTSVLDAITWALGGERYRPSTPKNSDSVIPPYLKVELSNGIIVERKGKNSALSVKDPSGSRAGQALLDSFIEELALNLPKFLEMNNKDKAKTLLKVIGMEDEIEALDKKEESLYQERLYKGRDKEQKEKYASELAFYEGVPNEPISVSELVKEQQEILAKNGENRKKRENLETLKNHYEVLFHEREAIKEDIKRLNERLKQKEEELEKTEEDIAIGKKDVSELKDESTKEIEESISNIEILNEKIRTNSEKIAANLVAKKLKDEYTELSTAIENIRQEKIDLLKNADLPLKGLSVEDGELTYNGMKWDTISGSEQLIVAASIVKAINPECGFVLMDKLEQMDEETMKEFDRWLSDNHLQVIATRVTTNANECELIIEDGIAVVNKTEQEEKNWKEGTF